MGKNKTSKRAKAPKKSNKAKSNTEADIDQDIDDYFTLSLLERFPPTEEILASMARQPDHKAMLKRAAMKKYPLSPKEVYTFLDPNIIRWSKLRDDILRSIAEHKASNKTNTSLSNASLA
jgi:hypothetical protein